MEMSLINLKLCEDSRMPYNNCCSQEKVVTMNYPRCAFRTRLVLKEKNQHDNHTMFLLIVYLKT